MMLSADRQIGAQNVPMVASRTLDSLPVALCGVYIQIGTTSTTTRTTSPVGHRNLGTPHNLAELERNGWSRA